MKELPVVQPGPVYAPVTNLMLYLTDDCPLRCTYCFVDKKPKKMTCETARKAVEFFLSRDISGSVRHLNINFFGGEPMLELDLMEEVIALARRVGDEAYKRVTFSATTSGTIATSRVERILRDTRMSLLVSLDGTRQASRHRPFLSGRESFPVVARNLARLVEWAGEVAVRMTFTPDNLDFVANVRQAIELGAPWIALCPVLECDWQSHQAELEAAYDRLLEWFVAELRLGKVPPLDVTWGLLSQHDRAVRFGAGRPARPCNVGTSLLAIDTEGNVLPCHRFLYRPQDRLGTVDSTALSSERWKYVHIASRELLGCDDCPANKVCGGGCRLVVLNARKGLDEVHPAYCVTMLAHYRAACRAYEALMAEQNPLFLNALTRPRNLSGPLAELSRIG